MAKIIEKHDNDKNYIFTCPVCGTVFTERERNIESDIGINGSIMVSRVRCPNCELCSSYIELKEYHEPPK